MTLDAEDIEAIAQRTAEITAQLILDAQRTPTAGELVDAKTLARQLNVSREYVYRHAKALGGQQIGGGTQPRWRFPAHTPPAPATPPLQRQPVRAHHMQQHVPLLPVHG